mmetsp:Transcript_81805/g.162346  ORF Transcript_81805/g.162346 Transcript_81805/m.162346 type:complete len:263 (-) Transcript_81805:827-1615(-)
MCDLLVQKAEDIQRCPCRTRSMISSFSEARISRTLQCYKALPSGLMPLEWVLLSCWMAMEAALPRTRQLGRIILQLGLTVPQSLQVFNKTLRDPWVSFRGPVLGPTFLEGTAHLPHLLCCLDSAPSARIQVHPAPECGQWTSNPVVAMGGSHTCLHSHIWVPHLEPHKHIQRRQCHYATTTALALAPLHPRASDRERWTMQSQWLARGTTTRIQRPEGVAKMGHRRCQSLRYCGFTSTPRRSLPGPCELKVPHCCNQASCER